MSWFSRLRAHWQKDQLAQELDAELNSHVEMRASDNVASGMNKEEALDDARNRFGNKTVLRERTRDMDIFGWLETLVQDLRYAIRTLRRSPGFTAAAVLSLALGIGANTAIFSFMNALLFKSLPIRNPQELVSVDITETDGSNLAFSYPLFRSIHDGSRSFAGVFGVASTSFNVELNGAAETVRNAQFVTEDYYSTLGVNAAIGHVFTASGSNENAVAVISDGYWKRHFGADPQWIGKTIHVNGTPLTLIGVTPPSFFGVQVGNSPDITVPMSIYARLNNGSTRLDNPEDWWLPVFARRRPEVSAQQVGAELEVIFQQYLESSNGPMLSGFTGAHIGLARMDSGGAQLHHSGTAGKPELILTLLMTNVGLVLLVACTNISNLLLARASVRRREFAVRMALGAGRSRLIRQLLTESLLLAGLGGICGFAVAHFGIQGILALIGNAPNSFYLDLSLDLRIIAFTGFISLLTAIIFGLAPSLRATRVDLTPPLKASCGGSEGMRGFRPARILVGFQVAFSLVLIVVAGLMVRTLQNLKGVDFGYAPENVLLVTVDPGIIGFKGASLAALYKDLLTRADAIPGVRSATLSGQGIIGGGGSWQNAFALQERRQGTMAYFQPVGPRFFATAGIKLVMGRDFDLHDNENGPKVVVVSEMLARQNFGAENPLGKTVVLGPNGNMGRYTVVGVARDASYRDPKSPHDPVVYFPFLQMPVSMLGPMTLAVRTQLQPESEAATLRSELLKVQSNLPIYDVKSFAQQLERAVSPERLIAQLCGFFAVLALALAAVGLYGVVGYTVNRRVNEIGIRIALGAVPGDILWLIFREVSAVVAVGAAAGVVLAALIGRIISTQLYGVGGTDPITLGSALLVLSIVLGFAAYLPARKACRLDPIIALRSE
jgi:predicted permease